MIQIIQKYNVAHFNYINLNLYDTANGKLTLDLGYRPLFSIKSQQTGSVKNFMPTTASLTKKERYIAMLLITTNSNNESVGLIKLGNDDFPYGFYDVSIYANTSDDNLDPAFANSKIFTGLMNLQQDSNASVEYKEYEENDSDTMSVYITNNIN